MPWLSPDLTTDGVGMALGGVPATLVAGVGRPPAGARSTAVVAGVSDTAVALAIAAWRTMVARATMATMDNGIGGGFEPRHCCRRHGTTPHADQSCSCEQIGHLV